MRLTVAFTAAALVVAISLPAQSSTISTSSFLERYRNSQQRDMCMSDSFDRKVDSVIIDQIPSILDECGIGGMIDICGLLGKFGVIFKSVINCGGGGSGGGSRFCDWGFDSKSAKEAWKIYRKSGALDDLKPFGYTGNKNSGELYANSASDDPEQMSDELLAQARMKVLGLSVE